MGTSANVIDTDVLVLGGGVSGCGAALAASDSGADVLVVDKGSLNACGQTGPGNANFHTTLGLGEGDTADEYTRFWGTYGEGTINPSIFHRAVSTRTHEMLKRLESIGIEFHKTPDGSYRRTAGLGQPHPWTTTMVNGVYFKRLLAKELRRIGIKPVEHTMVTKLLSSERDNRIIGATGFNIRTGEFLVFRAGAVVICLATTNHRISTTSTNNPFNAIYPFNTGSGPVMAFDAGARILALEKARATLIPIGFSAPGMAAFTGMGAYLVNASGERYMFRYDSRGEQAPRKTIVQATFNEFREGRGPCFVDARHLSPVDLDHMVRERLYVDGNTYPEYFAQKRLDMGKHVMEIELGEIRGGGCLCLNDQLESSIDGLFGYSPHVLSHAMCGGYSSALKACRYAMKNRTRPPCPAGQVREEKARLFAPMQRKNGYAWREYEDVIRQIMNYYMGFQRNERGMELALGKLNNLQGYAAELRAENYHELLRVNEVHHLVKYCQLVVRSTIERKESGRDCYTRSDYPKIDPLWDGKDVIQWKQNGESKIAVE